MQPRERERGVMRITGWRVPSASFAGSLSVAVVVSLITVMGMAPSAAASGDADEASCPFETEVSPGFRSFLPDCRAFELVTPPYKEGGVVLAEPAAIAGDGSHVIVGSPAAFAGAGNYWLDENRNNNAAVYELTRTLGGWQPTTLNPPSSASSASGFPHSKYPHSAFMAVSPENFETSLWGAASSMELQYNEDVYLRTGDGESEFHLVGAGASLAVAGEPITTAKEDLSFAGSSHNLRHMVFAIEAFKSEEIAAHHGRSNLWPGDITKEGDKSLYEYVYTGGPDAEPALVGVRNNGPLRGEPGLNEGAEVISECGTELGAGTEGSAYNAVSASGEAVFFTAIECPGGGGPAVNELYARIGGERTIAISEPAVPVGECTDTEPCVGAAKQSAVFDGASENGERVFFLSAQPLVNGAPAEGMKLYEERLEGTEPENTKVAEVIDVSNGDAGGVVPDVRGVARIARNGERVYFVAQGLLAGENHEKRTPEPGADNLYVYEPDADDPAIYHTVFVATLLTPGEEAILEAEEAAEAPIVEQRAREAGERAKQEALRRGVGEDEAKEIETEVFEEEALIRLPGTFGPSGSLEVDKSVWRKRDRRPVQATSNGQFIVFPSSARLTDGDESTVPQLFEYDAAAESLARVSIGSGGSSDGNVDTFAEAPYIPKQSFVEGIDRYTELETGLAISEDGSKIFFTSRAQLAPQAQPGATNVYEYEHGSVYLVSNGDDTATVNQVPAVQLFGINSGINSPVSSSGQNVFFTTVDQLVPQDGETQMALYDAREYGGFPAPSLEPGCLGETCRGESGAGPQIQAPGSAGQAGGGNLTPVTPAGPPGKKTTRPTAAQKLAGALRACRAAHARKRRASCEAKARRAYAARRPMAAHGSRRSHTEHRTTGGSR